MGFYRRYEAKMSSRAGCDVAQYDGWPMALIIRDYALNHDLATERDRVQMRRAILVSYEANCLVERKAFAL